MTSKQSQDDEEETGPGYVNKAFRLAADAVQAFDVLKAKQGPRSGVRLAAEAVDLVLILHGENPVGPFRDNPPKITAAKKPKAP